MVEFIRDVIIVVAILVTLIALAFHPAPDSESSRGNDPRANRISATGTITPAAEAATTKAGAPVPLSK